MQSAAAGFIDGRKAMTLRGAGIAGEFKSLVGEYIERRYGQGGTGLSPSSPAEAAE